MAKKPVIQRGRKTGPKLRLHPDVVALMLADYDRHDVPIAEIAAKYGISRASLYNYLNRAKREATA